MWIRSQDRYHLIDAKDIWIDFFSGIIICCETKCKENGIYTILGRYSSEEKALKVMDMIQTKIRFCTERYTRVSPLLVDDQWEPYTSKSESVFQMPQDDEVEV